MPTIICNENRAEEEERNILKSQHASPDFILCRHGKKDWKGADPSCAFDKHGNFRDNNWSCFLMNKVRGLMGQWEENSYGHYWWDDDQYYGVLYIQSWIDGRETDSYLQGSYILVDWYKSRGATDSFMILRGYRIHNGTEKDAKEIVRLYGL